MLHVVEKSTLVLVDLQTKLMPKIFEGQRVVNEAIRLGNIARILRVPIIGTEQNPEGLGENISEIKNQISKLSESSNVDINVVKNDTIPSVKRILEQSIQDLKTSNEKWLKKEAIIDDTTVCVIFLSGLSKFRCTK